MKCSSVFTSTTNHVFTFERVTLCTIILMHKDTGQQYVVIFTDNNKIRDYKAAELFLSLANLSRVMLI
ncbi:hypothetical protein VEE48_00260 (plasmid) [Escherichia coli]|nr:hypothetical protein VEE48_00260 [Escherichia coli]